MVCAPEARAELGTAIGLEALTVTAPTWIDHVYSCTYRYPNGGITLSVKELPNLATTSSYYGALAQRLGKANALYGLGQGAFVAPNGDAVVRKDYKVMLVDVSTLPNQAAWPLTRKEVAETITTTIMGCWTGA
jgi:hypothetical protein